MGYIITNFWPILAATLIGAFLGFAYAGLVGRLAFLKARPAFCLVAVLAEFWLAAILAGALILAPAEAGRWVMAIGSAVVIWIGFVLPALVVSYGFRMQPPRAVIGDLGYWLLVMVAQAALMEAIGLVHT